MPPSHDETITYTATGSRQSVDISDLDKAIVEHCDAAGSAGGSASGGRVKDAEIDLTGEDTLYLWVSETGDGDSGYGRYLGDNFSFSSTYGSGSSEISFSPASQASGNVDAPFLVGSGGAAAPKGSSSSGAREGSGSQGANQEAPPKGGQELDGKRDGEGAIDDQNRGLVTGGTTVEGGGSGGDTDGEIKITYKSAPTAPSDLVAEVS